MKFACNSMGCDGGVNVSTLICRSGQIGRALTEGYNPSIPLSRYRDRNDKSPETFRRPTEEKIQRETRNLNYCNDSNKRYVRMRTFDIFQCGKIPLDINLHCWKFANVRVEVGDDRTIVPEHFSLLSGRQSVSAVV